MPCFYCLEERIHISICFVCRTKFDRLADELKRTKKDLEITRRSYFKLMNNQTRHLKRNPKKRGK